MKNSTKTIFSKPSLIILLIFNSSLAFSQSANADKAKEIAREAIKLMDRGKIDSGINLLETAQKLDSKNVSYKYETAYAYHLKKDYERAIGIIEGILDHPNASNLFYQLLGNSYDNIDNTVKASEVYTAGLKKFPQSGNLYLELGVVQLQSNAFENALSYFEKGIEVDPKFPSNYYWAAKLFLSSQDEVWGMIYGELFMNLERNSRRTEEISQLLYNKYASEVKIINPNSVSVSFCKNGTLSPNDLKFIERRLPFGPGVYETTLMMSAVPATATEINFTYLDYIRTRFVEIYYQLGHHRTYPNVLFSYQKQIVEAGNIEAYNHWVLMKGDTNSFEKWHVINKEKWDKFIIWFTANPIAVNNANRFHRNLY